MYIALNNKLLLQFLSYQTIQDFDRDLIPRLFKYLQPFKIAKYQLSLIQPEIAKQLLSGNQFISTSFAETEEDLINDTIFKIMLTDDKSNYPYMNINDDELDLNFNATYKSKQNREKAKKHIQSFLIDADIINIYDKYFLKHWNNNSQLFKDTNNGNILKSNVNLKIFIDFTETSELALKLAKTELDKLVSNNKIEKYNDKTMHDRYIEADNIKIILTSGLDYLENIKKDFTYIIKEK